MTIGYTETTKIYNGSVNLQYNTQFQIYFCATFFFMRQTSENYKIAHKTKFWTHKIPTRKNLGPTKYLQEKIVDPWSTHKKKFETHEKKLEPTKYRWKKIGTHETPIRKKLGPTKYLQEKIGDPGTNHEKTMTWH